jgi:hypothetical protein
VTDYSKGAQTGTWDDVWGKAAWETSPSATTANATSSKVCCMSKQPQSLKHKTSSLSGYVNNLAMYISGNSLSSLQRLELAYNVP